MSTSASAASGHGKASGDSSHYHPLYPSNYPLDPSVKDFITSFFATSDVPGLTDEWLGFFREDATLVMGKDKAMGKEGEFMALPGLLLALGTFLCLGLSLVILEWMIVVMMLCSGDM